MGRFRRGFDFKTKLLMGLCGIAFVAAVIFLTMTLWNWLIPELFHGPTVTYWQAFGLLLLGKLLFGWHNNGGRRFGSRRAEWKDRFRDKWQNMTAEEQQELRDKMRDRCRGWNRWTPDARDEENKEKFQ
ncbi:hypothetical protein SAMN05444266_101437 [Chitinophaga jiangningensis]|uniref:Uncharacterized protein n=1 Tax=Chitinophaga jiangningensis TaxID=1419482 RepID=A0A1M6W0I1_9BACT|nr:hypothetical protein [Chitinophaga jiangningensis]SHK87271.1 hypothetical protein SAMN05444266_101437 [Chitinophaga jiangningensis]